MGVNLEINSNSNPRINDSKENYWSRCYYFRLVYFATVFIHTNPPDYPSQN